MADDVERYEGTEGDRDSTLDTAVRGLRGKIFFWAGLLLVAVIAAVSLLLSFGREEILRSIPVVERAWIVSRLEGEEIADDLPKTVLDGRGVMLYLVAYGLDRTDGEYYYYTDSPEPELPRVVIGDSEIPPDRLRRFEFLDVGSLVGWYKIEASPQLLLSSSRPARERLFWTESRISRMGDRWWTIADVRPDLYPYHYDYIGTMRFVADVQAFHMRREGEPYFDLRSEGASPETPGGLPPGAHRITVMPSPHYHSGLDRTYRAYFNLLAHQDHAGGPSARELTEAYTGGDSRSILTGALRELGYDVSYDDPLLLDRIARRVYDELTLDEFLFFRDPRAPGETIPYSERGVMPGDIFVQGDRFVVLVGDGDEGRPRGGVLSGDDLVLDAYDNLVRQTFAEILAESEEPIRIWRLRPLEEIRARDEGSEGAEG